MHRISLCRGVDVCGVLVHDFGQLGLEATVPAGTCDADGIARICVCVCTAVDSAVIDLCFGIVGGPVDAAASTAALALAELAPSGKACSIILFAAVDAIAPTAALASAELAPIARVCCIRHALSECLQASV